MKLLALFSGATLLLTLTGVAQTVSSSNLQTFSPVTIEGSISNASPVVTSTTDNGHWYGSYTTVSSNQDIANTTFGTDDVIQAILSGSSTGTADTTGYSLELVTETDPAGYVVTQGLYLVQGLSQDSWQGGRHWQGGSSGTGWQNWGNVGNWGGWVSGNTQGPSPQARVATAKKAGTKTPVPFYFKKPAVLGRSVRGVKGEKAVRYSAYSTNDTTGSSAISGSMVLVSGSGSAGFALPEFTSYVSGGDQTLTVQGTSASPVAATIDTFVTGVGAMVVYGANLQFSGTATSSYTSWTIGTTQYPFMRTSVTGNFAGASGSSILQGTLSIGAPSHVGMRHGWRHHDNDFWGYSPAGVPVFNNAIISTGNPWGGN